MIIIDVLRDFIYDINSPSESTQVSTYFMQWSDEFQVHTCTILHQNKGDNNERGHIGSEFINKAKMVIHSIIIIDMVQERYLSIVSKFMFLRPKNPLPPTGSKEHPDGLMI